MKNNVKELLTPKQFELLQANFDILSEEYLKNAQLKLESLIPIIGRPPIISQSPDMDTMLMDFEERALYGRKISCIESFIKEGNNVS